jgi:16S rRNA (cytosine1402-N4)-methyltransferase
MNDAHQPVMLEETLQALAAGPGGRYIDCTVGAGGHARAILELSEPGGQLLGIEADPENMTLAETNLQPFRGALRLVNDNFSNLYDIAQRYDFAPVSGILFDLGLSSMHLDAPGRGFSFLREAPLDMRFSPGQTLTAADILNEYSEAEIADIIWRYGEEARSRAIARRIVAERPLKTTTQLAKIVERVYGGRYQRLHPATQTFQALRIAVNDELKNLESALEQAVRLLGFSGRLVVLTYHSLEDRIVKHFMAQESRDCLCPPGLPE